MTSATAPLSRARSDRLTARISDIAISAKYSGGPKASATPARSGAQTVRPMRLSVPATNEEIAAIPSAAPALPCFASSYPSIAVGTDEASPGMLTTIAVVDPPYMAP